MPRPAARRFAPAFYSPSLGAWVEPTSATLTKREACAYACKAGSDRIWENCGGVYQLIGV
jgi:hypothetical protein